MKVVVQTLTLSGTKCICYLARRWVYLSAALRASASSRLLDWQNQGPEGRLSWGTRVRGGACLGGGRLQGSLRAGEAGTEEVREGEQTDLPVKPHLLLNFAKTQPRWLKSWSPSGSVCTGAHLLFSPAQWLPVWGCDPGVPMVINWESSN